MSRPQTSIGVPTGTSGLRACFKISRGPAARDFGCGQGGEFRASPQRAVRNEPRPATGKRPSGFVAPRSQTAAGMLPRRASPSGLLPENRPPANFKTGSKSISAVFVIITGNGVLGERSVVAVIINLAETRVAVGESHAA